MAAGQEIGGPPGKTYSFVLAVIIVALLALPRARPQEALGLA